MKAKGKIPIAFQETTVDFPPPSHLAWDSRQNHEKWKRQAVASYLALPQRWAKKALPLGALEMKKIPYFLFPEKVTLA